MVWIDLPFSFPLCYRATGMPGESRGLASVWRSLQRSVLPSSGCSPKPHPSLVSLLAEMGGNRTPSGSSCLCPTWVCPFTLCIHEGIFSVGHTDSVVLLDGEGSRGDTGCLLPEIPSDVQEEVLWEKERCSG